MELRNLGQRGDDVGGEVKGMGRLPDDTDRTA